MDSDYPFGISKLFSIYKKQSTIVMNKHKKLKISNTNIIEHRGKDQSELWYSGRVSSSCSTRVNPSVLPHSRNSIERTPKLLTQYVETI
jgi:hypothetical protein